jgi:hypothetical protein
MVNAPGSTTLKANIVTLGGTSNLGPVSIDGGTGAVEFSASDIQLSASNGSATLKVTGASASIVSPNVLFDAPVGNATFKANEITLYGGMNIHSHSHSHSHIERERERERESDLELTDLCGSSSRIRRCCYWIECTNFIVSWPNLYWPCGKY